MLVYYFVPFIVSNRYLLFWVSNGHNSVTVQNRTHGYMNFFHHKDLGNHLLQLCPKVVIHPVYVLLWLSLRKSHSIPNTLLTPIPGHVCVQGLLNLEYTYWIPLHLINEWLYVALTTEVFTVPCGSMKFQFTLQNLGMLYLPHYILCPL